MSGQLKKEDAVVKKCRAEDYDEYGALTENAIKRIHRHLTSSDKSYVRQKRREMKKQLKMTEGLDKAAAHKHWYRYYRLKNEIDVVYKSYIASPTTKEEQL